MPLDKRIMMVLTAILLTLGCVVFFMWQLSLVQERIAGLNQARHQSYLLADELRQSADDLTRMARTYVVTGNPQYKQYFHEILDIRNGVQPRPTHYSSVYWDLIFDYLPRPTSVGTAVPLLQLMKRQGFTIEELEKLQLAKVNSDDLAQLEKQAFAAVEGLYPDAGGKFTVVGEPQPELARELVYGIKYHRAKTRSMVHVNGFIKLLGERTKVGIERAKQREGLYLLIVAALVVLSIAISIVSFLYLRARVVNPIIKLEAVATRIKNGISDVRVPVEGVREVSRLNLAFNSLMDVNQQAFNYLQDEIEERKHTECQLLEIRQQLEIREESLSRAQRIAEVGNWDFDIAKGSLYWSDEIYRIFEFDPEKIEPSFDQVEQAVHPDDREFANESYRESLKSRQPYNMGYRIVMKDGRIKYVSSRCDVEYDQQGKALHSIGTIQDITARWEAEEALRQLQEELEGRVKQRTFELMKANDSLLLATCEAEQASIAKSNFLANTSHELRTPMNSILGLISLSQGMPELSDALKKNLAMAYGSATNLMALINNILIFSRLDEKNEEVDESVFELKVEINKLAANFDQDSQKKGLSFNLQYSENMPQFYRGDCLKLEKIISLLMSNAIKFTEQGEITLAFNGDQQNKLQVSVKDTGIGLSKESMAHVFDIFYQVDASSTRSYEGVGLGLSICQRLVELLGGELGVESVLGEGCDFHFTLPFAEESSGPSVIEGVSTSTVAAETLDAEPVLLSVSADEVNNILREIRLELENSGHPMALMDKLMACEHSLSSQGVVILHNALNDFDLELALKTVIELEV